MFIELCGIDGSGKSTQAKLLQEYFTGININSIIIHGYKPSQHSALLHEAKNNDYEFFFSPELKSVAHMLDAISITKKKIEPALREGQIVISDNYCMGSRVYAPIMGCDYSIVEKLIELTIKPDIIFFLKLDANTAYNRVEERNFLNSEKPKMKESKKIMYEAEKRYTQLIDETTNAYVINANLSRREIQVVIQTVINNYYEI